MKKKTMAQELNLLGPARFKKYYRALRPKRPLVTTCCASLNWVNAIREDGKNASDICLSCNSITTVIPISLEQYNKHYTNYPITEEHFNSLWNTNL